MYKVEKLGSQRWLTNLGRNYGCFYLFYVEKRTKAITVDKGHSISIVGKMPACCCQYLYECVAKNVFTSSKETEEREQEEGEE